MQTQRVPDSDNEHEKIEQLQRAMYSRSISPHLKDKERRRLSDTPQSVGNDWRRPEPKAVSLMAAPKTLGWSRALVRLVLFSSFIFFLSRRHRFFCILFYVWWRLSTGVSS